MHLSPIAIPRAGFTAKGTRTRGKIVGAAAQLIHDHGVAGTTVEHVRAVAEVSGSQLYHYFVDKDALVQAVIDSQAVPSSTTTNTRPGHARGPARMP